MYLHTYIMYLLRSKAIKQLPAEPGIGCLDRFQGCCGQLRQHGREYCEETSLHGIKYASRGNRLEMVRASLTLRSPRSVHCRVGTMSFKTAHIQPTLSPYSVQIRDTAKYRPRFILTFLWRKLNYRDNSDIRLQFSVC